MSKSYASVCRGRSFLPSLFKGHVCMKMGHWIILRMPISSTLATSPTIFSFLRHKTKILGPLSHINQEKTKAKFQTWIECFHVSFESLVPYKIAEEAPILPWSSEIMVANGGETNTWL